MRRLTKDLTIRFRNRECQVVGRGKGHRLRGVAVTVRQAFDGSVTVLRNGRELPVRLFEEGEALVAVRDEKTVARCVDRIKEEQQSRPACKPAGFGREIRYTFVLLARISIRVHEIMLVHRQPFAAAALLTAKDMDDGKVSVCNLMR